MLKCQFLQDNITKLMKRLVFFLPFQKKGRTNYSEFHKKKKLNETK